MLFKRKKKVTIEIIDNGLGIDSEELSFIQNNILTNTQKAPENHIGMFNCYNRYKVIFGERANITIKSKKGKGTSVIITVMK